MSACQNILLFVNLPEHCRGQCVVLFASTGDFTGSLAQIEDGLRKLNINEEVRT